MKATLIKREQDLIVTLDQLKSQEAWAKSHGYPDLTAAYGAAQDYVLTKLEEVQNLLKVAE